MEQGSRIERTAPIREEIVPCKSASHAGRDRVWGSCGERGQRLGFAVLINQAKGLCHSFLSESTNPPLHQRRNLLALSGRTGDPDENRAGRGQPQRPREEPPPWPSARPLHSWYVHSLGVGVAQSRGTATADEESRRGDVTQTRGSRGNI